MSLRNVLFALTLVLAGFLSFTAYGMAQEGAGHDANEELMKEAQKGSVDGVEAALQSGADVNARNEDGNTALMLAVVWGRKVAMIIPKKGEADVIIGPSSEAISLLLEKGADVNAVNNSGRTALMLAVKGGLEEVAPEPARLLLAAPGIEVNAIDNNGYTALMIAASGGHTNIVRLLLAKGADVNVANNYGQTALMLAAEAGYHETVKLLLARGSDVNAKNKYGYTALMMAVISGHVETVKLLLDYGADINAKREDGSALEFIAEYPIPHANHHTILKLLLAVGGLDEEILSKAAAKAKDKEIKKILTFKNQSGHLSPHKHPDVLETSKSEAVQSILVSRALAKKGLIDYLKYREVGARPAKRARN